jgi:glycosyltransferase involved in cell wall biosynthesis
VTTSASTTQKITTTKAQGNSQGEAGRRRVRVCVIAPSLRVVGGQAIQARRLMNHLERIADIEVGFIAHNPALPKALAWMQDVRYLRTIVTTAVVWVNLLLRIPRYDVLHIFSASYWSYFLVPMPAILLGRLFGKAVVLNYRSGQLEDHLERWKPIAEATMRFATRIVTPTPYLKGVLQRFEIDSEVIPNYLDIEHLEYRTRDPLRPIVLLNRLFEPLYNHRCALEAFSIMQREFPEARLIIVGYGPEEQRILEWIKELGIRNADFRGKVAHSTMMQLYQEADIYLNTPSFDCFPSSILDAFAAGVPLATTNAGGIRHIVEHQRTGWMVECNDAAGLAEGMIRFLREPTWARSLAEAGRKELETRYVWDAVGPQWERTYRELARR